MESVAPPDSLCSTDVCFSPFGFIFDDQRTVMSSMSVYYSPVSLRSFFPKTFGEEQV